MVKTNHKPEISKDGSQRVICGASGLWHLQKSTGFTHERDYQDGSNEHNIARDNQGPAMEYGEAKKAASHELREAW